jgi:hypothetical protein
VTYRGGRGWLVVLLGLTSLAASQVARSAMVHASVGVIAPGMVVFGATALASAVFASHACSRVELHPNGKLVLHYFVRPTVTIWIEEVAEINRGESDEWSVYFNRSLFLMSRNNSAALLVRALLRQKPTIALTGKCSSSLPAAPSEAPR